MIIVTDRRERFNPKEAQLSPAQALLALCKVLTDTFSSTLCRMRQAGRRNPESCCY
jgi:hypothetical protein